MPLLYDGDCGFCRVSVALVLAWDRRGRLRPVAIQSEEGQFLLADLSPSDRLASAHVVDSGGDVRSAGAVAVPVLRELPGGRPLARLAEWLPRVTARAYEAVARRRGALGRPLPGAARRWADRRIAARTVTGNG